MNKTLFKTLAACLLFLLPAATLSAKPDEAAKVRQLIDRVNRHWQAEHKPETNAFWDNAAYHTGNMEAYFLTGNEDFRVYSEAWAAHNRWMGARSNDRSRWKLTYGETDDHVLFGDWQVCFQTYVDLYNLAPDDRKIRRAREVMEYEMSTPRRDYWWWSDGLYMVMPVMTKLYKVTHNRRYLDKLHEYLTYSDSIMFDADEHLYYRDAKYVYPRHKSTNGKKDFWARGDGWVLAGLAKVLQDLPTDYRHRDFFVQKFRDMAAAVARLQQPEGYWTRSMMDPAHAPGPETSGTAFFTYGMLWGVNNGYLDEATFRPVIEKAWKYLSETALQKDGSVGYVQPIGEKAIPGQVVDAHSTANFGTGAFLLAACEYVRYLEAPRQTDRAYWCKLAYDMAYPVLSNLAKGELQKNMLVEVSPTWDGRDKRVTYMECFGRLMAGIAPWLSLPDDNTDEGKMRRELRELALKSYAKPWTPTAPTTSCGATKASRWWMPPTSPRAFCVPTTPCGCRSTKRPNSATSRSSPRCAASTRRTPTGCSSPRPSRASLPRQAPPMMPTASTPPSARWRSGTPATAGTPTVPRSCSTITAAMCSTPCTLKRSRR